ncbi:hypothetical protein QOZ80_8AG0614770 [Eleusine coracana subsp. coracana]|nr:hypothetical protein QOZ80_8AG0614770 [Eleusine coracana subsp. coracana]
MGKEEEKGTRVNENSSHNAPLLELTASGHGDSSQDVGTSHRREKVVTSKDCQHFCYDTEEVGVILARIEYLKRDPVCEDCLKETADRIAAGDGKEDPSEQKLEKPSACIMMCAECRRCFCAGLETNRHARKHATDADHPVAMWIHPPHRAICFKCNCALCLQMIIEAVQVEAGGHASVSADGRDYVARGIPNLGNTCYANVVMQCLLVLDKLRMWMLGPDTPTGSIGMALKELFMDAQAENDAQDMSKPQKLLQSVGASSSKYKGHALQDSQEFLSCLCDGLRKEEKLKRPPNIAEGVPTVIESIFQGEKATTQTCKGCGGTQAIRLPFYELTLPLPSKLPPNRSIVSSSPPKKILLRRWQETQAKSIAPIQLSTSDTNFEKEQTIADSADSHIPKLQSVTIEKGPMLLEVDSSEEDNSSLPSIMDCLEFYFKKEAVDWFCEKCSDVPKQPSTIRSKDGGQMMTSISGNTLVDRDHTEQSDRKGCRNEQIGPHDIRDQVGESQNKQDGHSDGTVVISKLPHVLTVRVLRFSNNLLKAVGHVKFEENLDVGPYVGPRSKDKVSSYGLVGVIEHVGNSLDSGHYAAYVRTSRIGSHQQSSSGSSSWFYTGDGNIKQVSIEEVLKCQAFLLFYERMEAAK